MKTEKERINQFKKGLESWCFMQATLAGQGPKGPYVEIEVSEMEEPGVFKVSFKPQ